MKDIYNLFNVENKIVLITGSSRGIGYKLAEGFAKAGSIVIINGRNQESLLKTKNEFENKNYKVYAYCFDVNDIDKVEKAIWEIENNIGPIDILINNAGIHRRALLLEMSYDQWEDVLKNNLSSVFYLSKIVAKYMIERKKGKIINISSLNAEGARPGIANYCAAKGGLKMLTKAMAVEWGQFNILVNAIGPGYFLTDLTKELAKNEEFNNWVLGNIPLKRWGNPQDLIGVAIFLASDASNYIHGQTIYVDGGWLAGL